MSEPQTWAEALDVILQLACTRQDEKLILETAREAIRAVGVLERMQASSNEYLKAAFK